MAALSPVVLIGKEEDESEMKRMAWQFLHNFALAAHNFDIIPESLLTPFMHVTPFV